MRRRKIVFEGSVISWYTSSLGKGFEPVEAIAPCDILRRGGADVKLGRDRREDRSRRRTAFRSQADCTVEEIDQNALEADTVILPGGLGGVESDPGLAKRRMDAVMRACG